MRLDILFKALPLPYWIILGGLICLLFAVSIMEGDAKVKGGKQRVQKGPLGDARFAEPKELEKQYETIDFDPETWRTEPDKRPKEPGVLLGDWHVKGRKKSKRIPYYYDKDGKWHGGTVKTRLFTEDQNEIMVAAAGSGKTSFVLAPNIEYALATGISFLTTDTKGDIVDKWAPVAEKYYGYKVVNYDLGHPLRSARFNILGSTNKYIDKYKAEDDKNSEVALGYLAKAESYAKAVAKTIILQGTDGNFGANSFFYDSAEGLLQAVILMVAEYAPPAERHILSVYQIIQEISGTEVDPKSKQKISQVKQLLESLPDNSMGQKIKMFAGASAQGGDSQASVVSTAMSRLLSFLDSEISVMLCGDSELDVEKFANEKTVIFLTVPEEQQNRYFMLSLIVQEVYNELLEITRLEKNNNKVPMPEGFQGEPGHQRIMFWLDEIGTLPAIQGFESMLSASRSRRIFFFNIVQATSQLEKNYGKEKTDIILANCKLLFIAGLAPLSSDISRISKVLGKYTIQTNSVSTSAKPTGGSSRSRSVQMTAIDLMSETEIQQDLGLGKVLIIRAGDKPIMAHYDLFLDWGIKLDLPPLEFKAKRASDIKITSKQALIEAFNADKKPIADKQELRNAEEYAQDQKKKEKEFSEQQKADIANGKSHVDRDLVLPESEQAVTLTEEARKNIDHNYKLNKEMMDFVGEQVDMDDKHKADVAAGLVPPNEDDDEPVFKKYEELSESSESTDYSDSESDDVEHLEIDSTIDASDITASVIASAYAGDIEPYKGFDEVAMEKPTLARYRDLDDDIPQD